MSWQLFGVGLSCVVYHVMSNASFSLVLPVDPLFDVPGYKKCFDISAEPPSVLKLGISIPLHDVCGLEPSLSLIYAEAFR